MRILLTLQAILNYLYNNLIDLVWVKKVRFEDNSKQLTSAPKLYDIKLLSQAVADKGWAFMCKETTQNLSKNDVPTLYNDIYEKFNNQEKVLQDFNTNNTLRINWVVKFDNVYYGSFSNDNPPVYKDFKKSNNIDFSNSITLNLPTPTDTFFNLTNLTGLEKVDNYLVLSFTKNNWQGKKSCFLFCDSEFNVINEYVYDRAYRALRTINNEYIVFCSIEDNDDNKLIKLTSDGVFVSIIDTFRKNGYWYEPEQISNDGKIMFCTYHSGGSSVQYNGVVTIYDNTVNFARLTGSSAGTFGRSPAFNNVYGVGTIHNSNSYMSFYQIASDGLSESLLGEYLIASGSSTPYIAYGIYRVGERYIIPCSFGVLETYYFNTFTKKDYNTTPSSTQTAGSYADENDCYIYYRNTSNYYEYSGFSPMMYTDTYTIDGETVTVNYYKYNDFKIAISDNGGTNDANIIKVFNYLGYSNYFVLNLTNETIAIQRDKRTYTCMFVDDNFQDTLFDLPENTYAPSLPSNKGVSYDNIIIKSDTIPEASIDNYKKIYMYTGVNSNNFKHNYIYECKANVSLESVFYLNPSNIFSSEDFYKAGLLLMDATPNYSQVTNGSMTYIKSGDAWHFTLKDANNNVIDDNFQIYTQNLIDDYDFVAVTTIEDLADGTVIDFTVNSIEHTSGYRWERVNVQPDGGDVEYIDDASISLNIYANKNYVFTNNNITDITFNDCDVSFEETTIEFSTGNSAPTLTDNSGIEWVDASTPILNANTSYIILIWNKKGFVREY